VAKNFESQLKFKQVKVDLVQVCFYGVVHSVVVIGGLVHRLYMWRKPASSPTSTTPTMSSPVPPFPMSGQPSR